MLTSYFSLKAPPLLPRVRGTHVFTQVPAACHVGRCQPYASPNKDPGLPLERIPEGGLHLITHRVAQVSVTTWRRTVRITKIMVSAAPVTPMGIQSVKHH